MCEFPPKIPVLGTCSLQRSQFVSASQTCNKKSFSRKVFPVKKWETSQKLEWNGFMYSLSGFYLGFILCWRSPEWLSATSFIGGSRVMPPLEVFYNDYVLRCNLVHFETQFWEMLQWYSILFFSRDQVLTMLHLAPTFVHTVAIQLINRMYSTITESAVRPADCNTPCSLSYSVLRQKNTYFTCTDLVASGWFCCYSYLYTVLITIFFGGVGGGGNFYPSNTLDRTLSVDEENCREPAKQQRKGEWENKGGRTRWDESLSCTFHQSYLVFYLLIL